MGCGHGGVSNKAKPRSQAPRGSTMLTYTAARSEQNRSLDVVRSPGFGECRHRGLARRLVAVRRRAILMMPEVVNER
jgi:hypothetical protein